MMMRMIRLSPRRAAVALVCCTASLGAQSLTVTPTELTFQAELAQPSPPSQTFQIQTDSPGESFSAQVKVGLISADWLSLLPTNGETPATVTVSVDSSRFRTAGSRTADIEVQAAGELQVVKVNLDVAPSSGAPSIQTAPSTLAFSIPSPGLAAQAQQLIVSNTGGGFLSYQVGVTYPASGPQGWLQVEPASGEVSFDSALHQVNVVNTINIAEGEYEAQIVITGGATNSPFAIPVTLAVGAAPALSATPASLSFFASEGGGLPEIQDLEIRNSGGTDLSYTIAGDQPWLRVRPAQGDTTQGPQVHEVLPDTRELAQGVYLGNLEIRGEALAVPFLIPVRLAIGPPSTLFVLPSQLDFLGHTGIPIRERRSISIVNTPLGPGRWTASVVPPTASWLKVSPASGQAPGRVQVEVDTAGLAASNLEAEIEVSSGGGGSFSLAEQGEGPGQTISTVRIPVRATILAGAPVLGSTPEALRFHAIEGQAAVLQQNLLVENLGGPQLLWQSAVTTDAGDWLSISPPAGEAPTQARVSASPSGLSAGVYHGTVRLVAGGQDASVPVAFVVSPSGAQLDTDVSSLYWEMTENGAPPAARQVRVLNRGSGVLSWTAHAVEFSSAQQWFGIGPASGSSSADGQAAPSSVTVTPIGAGLPAGVYGGLIEIRAEGQNPRLVTATLRVVSASESVQRRVEPAGVSFIAQGAGGGVRTVTIHRNRGGAAPFLAAASTVGEAAWLNVSPTSGAATESGEVELEVSANSAGLAPGVYTGQVGLTFGDGLVESVAATLVVPPTGAGPCIPSAFDILPVSPPEGFRAFTGRAVGLEVELWDDCGRAVEQASVVASFGTGDSAAPLRRVGEGRYAATWGPANAGSQANLVYTARAGALVAQRFVVGAVEGSSQPALSRFGVVNAGSFGFGEAISPGAIVTAFGRGFLPQRLEADAVPLPEELGGVRLHLAGGAAPLYFKNIGQINAQAPFELVPHSTAQAVVSVNRAYSVPEELPVAAAKPGVFFFPSAAGPGRAIVQNQSGAINGPGSPALPGEAIVVYLSGIGAVDPAVATGAGAPAAEPLARATLEASAMVGDKPAQVFFLGLSPGFVGLAQANLVLPADAPVGDDVPLNLVIGGQLSNPLVISIAPAP